MGIGQGTDLSDILAKWNIDSKSVSNLANLFKDNTAELLESIRNNADPQKLRDLLASQGINTEEINKIVSQVQNAVRAGGERAHLAFGLILAFLVIFRM